MNLKLNSGRFRYSYDDYRTTKFGLSKGLSGSQLSKAGANKAQHDLIAWLGSLEAIMSRHHTSSRSTFPEHPPQVIHKCFRLFVRRKVATRIMFRLEHNVRLGAKESAQMIRTEPQTTENPQRENDERSGGLARLLWKERYPDGHLQLLHLQIQGVA
jgi:hypothetical protein